MYYLRPTDRCRRDALLATVIEPAWADEAFADDDALVDSPDPASKSGRTDRLVGYSRTARMVIVVIYLRDELIGVNAWKANEANARRYWEAHTMKKKELEELVVEETTAS